MILTMSRQLDMPFAAAQWPANVRLVPLDPYAHPARIHALLHDAYANGSGSVPPLADWWRALESDSEYDPDLCLVAVDADGRIAGVAQCWTSAFIKDLAVAPPYRRLGVGKALLASVFQRFQDRNAGSVALKVHRDNDPALTLYRQMGFTASAD